MSVQSSGLRRSGCAATTGFLMALLSLHFKGHFPGEPGLAGVY